MLFMLQTNIYKENKVTFKFNQFSHQIIRFFCNSNIKHKFSKILTSRLAISKMATYFKTTEIEIGNYECVKRPELNKSKSFYIIYSPEKFKLRPRDNILLDLKIKVNAPESLEACINLSSCLKEVGFAVEDHS